MYTNVFVYGAIVCARFQLKLYMRRNKEKKNNNKSECEMCMEDEIIEWPHESFARLSHFNANVCKLFNLRLAIQRAACHFFHPNWLGVRSPCVLFFFSLSRIPNWVTEWIFFWFNVFFFWYQDQVVFHSSSRFGYLDTRSTGHVYILVSSKDGRHLYNGSAPSIHENTTTQREREKEK